MLIKIKIFFCFSVFIYALSSCNSSKSLHYFSSIADTTIQLHSKDFEPKIQKGDILYMGVTSADPNSSLIFNSVNAQPAQAASGAITMSQNVTSGVLVTSEGTISLPYIGTIIAEGKTKNSLAKEIENGLKDYLKEPKISLRFMNYRVTVLGEVNKPGTFTIPNERISVLEALGLAGDLTLYGNRNDILYVHENNGAKEFHRLNLNDNSIFSSPYFYLQSNDVIYVSPNKTKVYNSSQFPIYWPIIANSFTLILLIYNSLK